jgi:hypothetical protein
MAALALGLNNVLLYWEDQYTWYIHVILKLKMEKIYSCKQTKVTWPLAGFETVQGQAGHLEPFLCKNNYFSLLE